MLRVFRLLGLIAVGVGAATADRASAGPIRWSYTAEVEYTRDYGDDFRLEWIDQTGSVTSTPGEYVSHGLFTTSAYGGPPRPTDPGMNISYSFGVRVTLTDEASGDSRVLGYNGWYSSEWVQKFGGVDENGNPIWVWDWVGELSGFGNPVGWDTYEIGRNLYTVQAYGGAMGSNPNGTLVVSASPTPTPEPTTLALAGVGLAGLAFARRVRRCLNIVP